MSRDSRTDNRTGSRIGSRTGSRTGNNSRRTGGRETGGKTGVPSRKPSGTNNSKGNRRKGKKKGFLAAAEETFFMVLLSVLSFFESLFERIKEKDFTAFIGTLKKRAYYIAGFFAVATLVTLIVLVVWLNTNINAQEVYLDGQLIGVIQDKTITADTIFESAKMKLEKDQGAPVIAKEKVTTEPVHANKTDELDYVIGKIYNLLTYQVQAVCISVDGVETVTVKQKKVADEILDSIKNEYMQEGLNITSKEFVEDVATSEKYVDVSEISTRERALTILTSNRSDKVEYVTQSGDSYWKIANDADMTLDELFALNPTLDPDPTKLKTGTAIAISRNVPFLSVRTKERVEYEETIPMPIESATNDAQPKSYSKVIQQGRDGRRRITADIVRINGYEVARDVIETTILEEAVAQITEKGTK